MLIKDLPDYCNAHECFENCEYTKECNKHFKTFIAPSFFSEFIHNMDLDIKNDSEIGKEESA